MKPKGCQDIPKGAGGLGSEYQPGTRGSAETWLAHSPENLSTGPTPWPWQAPAGPVTTGNWWTEGGSMGKVLSELPGESHQCQAAMSDDGEVGAQPQPFSVSGRWEVDGSGDNVQENSSSGCGASLPVCRTGLRRALGTWGSPKNITPATAHCLHFSGPKPVACTALPGSQPPAPRG